MKRKELIKTLMISIWKKPLVSKFCKKKIQGYKGYLKYLFQFVINLRWIKLKVYSILRLRMCLFIKVDLRFVSRTKI